MEEKNIIESNENGVEQVNNTMNGNKGNGSKKIFGGIFTVFVIIFAAAVIFMSLKNDGEESADTTKYANILENKYRNSVKDFKDNIQDIDNGVFVNGGDVKCKDGSDSVKCNIDDISVSVDGKNVFDLKNISILLDGFDKKNVSKYSADFTVKKDVEFINNGKMECIRTISGKKSENSIYDDLNCKLSIYDKVDFNLLSDAVLYSKDFNKDKLGDMVEYIASRDVELFDNVTYKFNKLDLSVKSNDLFGYIYEIANFLEPISKEDLVKNYDDSKKVLGAVVLLYIPGSLDMIDSLFAELDKVMKNNYNNFKAEILFGDTLFSSDMSDAEYKELLEKLDIKFSASK